mgnify:CR=1 FL=1
MDYQNAFRNPELVKQLVQRIHKEVERNYTFMEVCGGHTMAIHHFGIPGLLPDCIRLLSGPGCPVCVSSAHFVDSAIAYARMEQTMIASYGDLIKVPGSAGSLEEVRAEGALVEVVYSASDAVKLASNNPDFNVVFLGIGFETTAPVNALAIKHAAEAALPNFFMLSAQKIMPPALRSVASGGSQLDGFICPGHVSAITGSNMYSFLVEEFGLACVISGFEPVDILYTILKLVLQVNQKKPLVEIQYKRAVKPEGNEKAKALMDEVYELKDDYWRGFGVIPKSGLQLSSMYASMDATKQMPLPVKEMKVVDRGCICGEILKGLKLPKDCALFGGACHPGHPVGPCMVSSEGVCQAHFKYHAYV